MIKKLFVEVACFFEFIAQPTVNSGFHCSDYWMGLVCVGTKTDYWMGLVCVGMERERKSGSSYNVWFVQGYKEKNIHIYTYCEKRLSFCLIIEWFMMTHCVGYKPILSFLLLVIQLSVTCVRNFKQQGCVYIWVHHSSYREKRLSFDIFI